MSYRVFISAFTLLFCLSISGFGQSPTQNIRGTIIDIDSKITLPGANIIVVGSDPILGSSTDMDGNFKIENVPVGRHTLQITYLGYEDKTIPNVLIESGKEKVMTIELTESFRKLKEVQITAKKQKSQTMNEMAMVSGNAFSVEETQRYAASIDDPGRMALSYAGVIGGYDGTNEIVIRGNSPRGLLWRLEGIEIPNPNHFSEEGAAAGGVSALSSNMMTNSDFFTGAFPAEYGNAASGVFDIRLRKGNNEKREYALQAGVMGTDFAFEGPFKKGGRGSYLINYRYSTLAVLNAIGVDIIGDAVPVFQDLSFNFTLPTKKAGQFTLFGIGGLSNISMNDPDFRNTYKTNLGIGGMTHTFMLGKKTYLKTVAAWTGTENEYRDWERADAASDFYNDNNSRFVKQATRVSTTLNHKFNARNTIKTGLIYSALSYDLQVDYFWEGGNTRVTELAGQGSTNMLQGFANWKYRITDKLTLVTGLHYLHLTLNDNYSIEPRAGLKWKFSPRHSFSAGFGIHSQRDNLSTYLYEDTDDQGMIYQPNRNLDFAKARHYVFGYDFVISENLFLKTETYYQELYNVGVQRGVESHISMLNLSDNYADIPLENTGTGTNYGVELTLEKYFSDNYYFLVTGSLFESKYKGSDGIERNTRFNSKYATNVLAGKEFVFGSDEKKKTFGLSVRTTYVGGQRMSPIDLETSMLAGTTVRDHSRAFEEKVDDYLRIDLQVNLRSNRAKTTHILKLDIQNVTNRQNTFTTFYDAETQSIQKTTQLGLIPVISYKVKF